jgi:WD40 repeat protein
MSLSVEQVREIFDNLIIEYENLMDGRAKLEQDCSTLRGFIDVQVERIRALNADFEQIRQEYLRRRHKFPRVLPSAVPVDPPATESEPDWHVELLVPRETLLRPLSIVPCHDFIEASLISSTAFSSDGSRLAFGSNCQLRVYDFQRDRFVSVPMFPCFEPNRINHVRAIAWSRGGTLLSGFEDGRILVFSLKAGIMTDHIVTGCGPILQIEMQSSNESFITVAPRQVSFFSFPGCNLAGSIACQTKSRTAVSCCALHWSDRVIGLGHIDGSVDVWLVNSRVMLFEQKCHEECICAMRWLPFQDRLVTGGSEGQVKIWTLCRMNGGESLNLDHVIQAHSDLICSLAVDPLGEFVVSASKDMTVGISGVFKGELIYRLKGHDGSVATVAYNPTGTGFCSGSADACVKVWTVRREGLQVS